MRLPFGFAIVYFFVILSIYPSVSKAEQRRPNVVFFLLDDLGWKDLGCYGSDFYETPNIDAFAKAAAVLFLEIFEKFINKNAIKSTFSFFSKSYQL